MTSIVMPYFMENKDWYVYDKEKGKYILTDKAPEEAKKSYDEFYGNYSMIIDLGIIKEDK